MGGELKIGLKLVPYHEVKRAIQRRFESLPSSVDSFFESHVIQSNHYQLSIDDACAGFGAIHQSSLITQFFLEPEFMSFGQSVYRRLKTTEMVQNALVPTCDEFFLSHALDALDEHRDLNIQAYLFALVSPQSEAELGNDHTLNPVQLIRNRAPSLCIEKRRSIPSRSIVFFESDTRFESDSTERYQITQPKKRYRNMDDLIGGLKEKAKEFGMEKVKEEADKRGLGGVLQQAEGFLGLGGAKAAAPAEAAVVPAATPSEASESEEAPDSDEEGSEDK